MKCSFSLSPFFLCVVTCTERIEWLKSPVYVSSAYNFLLCSERFLIASRSDHKVICLRAVFSFFFNQMCAHGHTHTHTNQQAQPCMWLGLRFCACACVCCVYMWSWFFKLLVCVSFLFYSRLRSTSRWVIRQCCCCISGLSLTWRGVVVVVGRGFLSIDLLGWHVSIATAVSLFAMGDSFHQFLLCCFH